MLALLTLRITLLAALAAADTHGITPHVQYSSSVGVLGCKIDTNRVAYWPMSVDCDNICVRVSYAGRSVELLRIDQSGGAFDISYDAYNYLVSGKSARESPVAGGPVNMDVQNLLAENCAHYFRAGGGLPLSASNSMSYVASCLQVPSSFVARNHTLWNIQDPVCHWGYDEPCSLDLVKSNQPSCPHGLGTTNGRLPDTVFNIEYPSGARVAAP